MVYLPLWYSPCIKSGKAVLLRQRMEVFFLLIPLSLFSLVLQHLCEWRNSRDSISRVKWALSFLGRQMKILAHPCSLQILYMVVEFAKFHPSSDCSYPFVRSSLLPVRFESVQTVGYVNHSKPIDFELKEGCQENRKDVIFSDSLDLYGLLQNWNKEMKGRSEAYI